MADYRKMWEELGMDVDLHDQLCAVLPQAFGGCIFYHRKTVRILWTIIIWWLPIFMVSVLRN